MDKIQYKLHYDRRTAGRLPVAGLQVCRSAGLQVWDLEYFHKIKRWELILPAQVSGTPYTAPPRS